MTTQAPAKLSTLRETRAVNVANLEMRENVDGSGLVTFSGYASLTNTPYRVTDFLGEYDETIAPGAFTKALQENDDVRLLLNHEGVPLARTKSGTLTLAEDSKGLRAEAQLDASSPLVQTIRSAMSRGDLDQMSFAFSVVKQSWSQDYTERTIHECRLFDVSVVTYPASPTTTADLRGQVFRLLAEKVPAARVAEMRKELRIGRQLSEANIVLLESVLQTIQAAGETIEEAGDTLAELVVAAGGTPTEPMEPAKMEPGEMKAAEPNNAVVISDIDGTLIANGSSIPGVVGFVESFGVPVIVVTGRPESERDATVSELDGFGIMYADLRMNPGSSADSVAHKEATAADILKTSEVLVAVENDPDARAAYEGLGVATQDPATIEADQAEPAEPVDGEPMAETGATPRGLGLSLARAKAARVRI
jgi:HK97 family phage prohead protease